MADRTVDPDRLRGVLDDYGLTYRVASKSYVFTCPLCNGDDKLWMYRDTGRFVCVKGCSDSESRGFSGAPEYAIQEMTGVELKRIQEKLYGVGALVRGRTLDVSFGPAEGEWEEGEPEVPLPVHEAVEWPFGFYRIGEPQAANGQAYLEGRGISAGIAAEYGVGYYPMRRSVVFPVYERGALLGWQYRIIDAEMEQLADGNILRRPKAITESIPRSSVVMFADRLLGSPHAVVGEGPIDALKAHLCGGNVATMGKTVADGQIAFLIRNGLKVVYSVLDPDALPEVCRLVRRLGDDVEFHHVSIPRPYKDLGAMAMADVPDVVFNSPIMKPGRVLPIWFPERRVG